ncbi:MAG: hypothetical protein HYS12_17750 [Planctomycetes bacterium]|nr:hypothetical protein [Planctomycetota bacterium]
MKCRAVRAWMLTDETPQRPPPRLRRHLQRCPRCRKRYGRLVRLIHEVQEVPLPSTDCPARMQLLERLAAVPSSAPPPVILRPPRRVAFVGRWVAAAVLLLTIGTGLLVLNRKRNDPPQPWPSPAPTATAPAERPLEDRVLQQHLRLAEADGPTEQLDALASMAADLRTESLRAARRGADKDVAYLAWLHARVVEEGIVPSAVGLSAEGKDSLPRVLAQLRRTEAEVREARKASPKASGPLEVLEETAREAIRALEGDPAVRRPARPSEKPPVELASRDLLRVLVAESLLVVGEDDPARRAGHSSRVADSLARALVAKGEAADPKEAARLGENLSDVVNRGVMSNLEQVDPEDADEEQKEEAAQARKRAGEAVAAVKRNLLQLPEAARHGLERALENKRPDKPREHGKGKGKGPRKEKPRKPPGRPHGQGH